MFFLVCVAKHTLWVGLSLVSNLFFVSSTSHTQNTQPHGMYFIGVAAAVAAVLKAIRLPSPKRKYCLHKSFAHLFLRFVQFSAFLSLAVFVLLMSLFVCLFVCFILSLYCLFYCYSRNMTVEMSTTRKKCETKHKSNWSSDCNATNGKVCVCVCVFLSLSNDIFVLLCEIQMRLVRHVCDRWRQTKL